MSVENCQGCVYLNPVVALWNKYLRGCETAIYLCQKAKPQTNADRIRAMTDEELADWLNNDVEYWGKWCHDDAPVDQETLDCLRNGGECRLCILDWLKEEAVSDG